ncbi:uncharacterized protein METZ01_LOCUS79860 [marine metagenome]|uniref:ABC transporter domain-containing protein n=1 Tax=marine metagenome TaxID=408172 RepID=A0A381UFK8_9ZZZZ|tara:strand:+ start:200 stop:931 length:732 start_codon:yes stop_codon:yes gene_type:complete
MSLLKLTAVNKAFGSLEAVKNVECSIAEGEVVGIIGPNGAGKSTLFNLITGDLSVDSGEILFLGQPITTVPTHKRCIAGIGRSYQIPLPFEGLSTFENLIVAAISGGELSKSKAEGSVVDILALTGLLHRANTTAGQLTLIERKRLELARAVATNPKLLLLDEIAGGLTTAECEGLVDTIKKINAEGVTIIWIEHLLRALLQAAERLIVLDFGESIAEGPTQEVMNNPIVKRIYMGIKPIEEQ